MWLCTHKHADMHLLPLIVHSPGIYRGITPADVHQNKSTQMREEEREREREIERERGERERERERESV